MVVKVGVILGSKASSFAKEDHYAMESRYFKAISKVGGLAIPISYIDLEAQLELVDKILLPGGDFKSPDEMYTNTTSPYSDGIDWYNAYIQVIEYGFRTKKPIMGICAGMQTLNIALGGKLKSHVEDHRETNNKLLSHSIEIKPDTILHTILNKDETRVNSIHNEAISALSDDIIISARSKDDKIIEAIEFKNHDRAMAFQWHPECLLDGDDNKDSNSYKIFDYFVNKL